MGDRIGHSLQLLSVNLEKCTKNLVENYVEFVENGPCDLSESMI